MKRNKIVKNTLKNGINIVTIISSFIIISQLKPNTNNTQLAIQEASQEIAQEEKVAENTESLENKYNTEEQVTSRHSTVRTKRSEGLEQAIENQEKIQETIIEQQYTKMIVIIWKKEKE